jgi:hypothetical protein
MMAKKSPNFNVFISWSGERSLKVAELLKNWLPTVVEQTNFWISSEDIRSGTRWLNELSKQLEQSNFGICIVTSESINSTWLHFEAGALSKNLQQGRIIPYLVSLNNEDLKGPLSHFQALRADHVGTINLVKTIQAVCPNHPEDNILMTRFEALWPQYNEKLQQIISQATVNNTNKHDLLLENLEAQIADLTKMVRQLVNAWSPEIGIDRVNVKSILVIKELEGAWVDSLDNTRLYIEEIGGKLSAPYCYKGNNNMTGVFFDWRIVGEYWFSRFRWLNGRIKGFAFWQRISQDVIEGRWWVDESNQSEIPQIPKLGGSKSRLERLLNPTVPDWATEYFDSIRQKRQE